jgi:hypothetical protein
MYRKACNKKEYDLYNVTMHVGLLDCGHVQGSTIDNAAFNVQCSVQCTMKRHGGRGIKVASRWRQGQHVVALT